MWDQFCIAFIVGLLAIYLPGFIFFKALRFGTTSSLVCAPICTIATYIILTTSYGFLSISCNAFTLLIIPTFVFGSIYLLLFICQKKQSLERKKFFVFSKKDTVILLGYLACGMLLCLYFFIKSLDGASSFFCRVDNITHLSLINTFSQSDVWSSLAVSSHLPDQVSSVNNPATFYPAGWHYLVALVVQITNFPVTLCVNAINAIFIGIIYPSGCFLLLKALFKQDTILLCIGAVVALSFTAFPWGMLLKGPLYPNFASFSLLPIILGGCILFIESPLGKKNILQFFVFLIFSCVALALTQTNALFSALVFATFYLAHHLYQQAHNVKPLKSKIKLPALVFCAAILLWIISFKAPFMQGVVSYEWESDLSLIDGLFSLLSLSLSASVPQILLSCTIPFGLIYCLGQKKAWLLFPALFMACAYLECRCGSGLLKHLIAGFWYTDPYRLAANVAIFLVPIATAGLRLIIAIFGAALHKASTQLSLSIKPSLAPIFVTLVFALIVYFPNYTAPRSDQEEVTAFGIIKNRIESVFDTGKEQVYSAQEQEFVEKALNMIPDGSLVINQPNDGSVFAYAVNDMNIYYRNIIRGESVSNNETEEAVLIRTKLNEYDSNPAVQNALDTIHAEYVLILDYQRAWTDAPRLPQSTQPSFWKGIDDVSDTTPGFEIVLAEDDMRLYRIIG